MASRMWWTQPKLALIVLAVNGGVIGLLTVATDSLEYRAMGLIAAQFALLAAYWRASTTLGGQHLERQTGDVFDRRLWNKQWRPSPSFDKWTAPPDSVPREGGGSFYQQMLGDSDEAREALYRAISAWEGARLLWIGGLVTVGLALASSAIGTMLAQALDGGNPASRLASAAVLPVCVLALPEAFVILRLRRAILRAGVVERAAVLVPRDAVDLGFRTDEYNDYPDGMARDGWLVMSVALGAPVMILVAILGGFKALALAIVAAILGVIVVIWAVRTFMRMLVSGIPFLRFAGPLEVSVLVDLAHRRRAYLSASVLMVLPSLLVSYARSHDSLLGLFDPVPVFCLLYLTAITFGDQLSGYAGFMGATHFEFCFKRSTAKMEAAAS